MSDKEVKIKITGDISDLLKKLETIKDSLDDLGKESLSNKFMDGFVDGISDGIEKLEQLEDAVEDTTDAAKKMESATDNIKEYNKQISDIDNNSLKDTSKHITDITDAGEQMKDTFNDIGDIAGNMGDLKFEFIDNADPNTFLDDVTSGIVSGAAAGKIMSNSMQGIVDDIHEISKASTDIISSNAPLEEKIKYYDRLIDNIERATKEVDEYTKTEKALDDLNKLNPEWIDEYNKKLKEYLDINKEIQDIELQLDSDNTLLEEIKRRNDYLEKQLGLEEKLNDLRKKRSESEEELAKYQEQERQVIETLDYQAKQYEMLVKQISELNKEEKANVLVKEKMLKMLDETAEALNEMGANVERIPEGVFKKLSKEAKEFVDQLKDMDKHVSFEYLSKDLDQLGKSIDDKTSKLIKYREINDSLSGTSKKRLNELEKEAAAIKEFADNAGFVVETLEKEGQVIRKITTNHEKLNDSLDPQYVEEYANAMREYLQLINETGGKISDRFMKDDGSFDISKYIDDYIKFGKPLSQLTMQYSALKAEALEYLKLEDKSIDDKAKVIKSINEEAEALRKLGAAAEGIKRTDIEGFDKTLASKLDNLKDVFDKEKLPETIKEFRESLEAAFGEFGNLEFGKGFDMIKDVGKGIFDKIPAGAKAATIAIGGVATALVGVYEYGKKEFFTGLTGAVDKLKPVIDMLQNFGQEVVSAFEQITDTDLDLGSLMALGPEFEYQMQKVGAIAGSNAEQLAELTAEAERLGGTTQFTASQVGEAFEYMAMAGYTTEEMIASMEDTLNLAIISGTDLGKVSDIVTDYMTAMGMEANSTGEFVDKLAATVTSANTTVELFGTSMKQVASQAGMLGITMTDISTAIGLAANAGVKGSKAGTALKNLLANMAAPTKAQAAALEELGFEADKAGSYLIALDDGSVNLEATMKKLMTATEGMSKAQKTALIVAIAGKEAAPGILAILNQGVDAWEDLSEVIDNSTASVQYWNECMSIVGKSGDEARKTVDKLKDVFEETSAAALELGVSSEELSVLIALLNNDGKVAAANTNQLVSVIDAMNTSTKETDEIWRSLDKSGNDLISTGYDYDATIAKIASDTSGLSQETKKEITNLLDANLTYEQANKILEKYGLTAERTSVSTMSFVEKLQFLRDNYKEAGDAAFTSALQQLGLGDSIDEVREICKMSETEWQAYIDNIEKVGSMTDILTDKMNQGVKAGLLNLASAIENVAIAAYNKLEPALQAGIDALNEFFEVWHNREQNEFTFDGLEKGLAGLSEKLGEYKDDIANAIAGLFEGINIFVNEGSLQSILDMATSIITGICDGIAQAKEDGTLDEAVSGIINKIATWIHENSDQVKQAGLDILDAIKKGINENEDIIKQACDDIADIMASWAKESASIKSAAGALAEVFVNYATESFTTKIRLKGEEWIKAIGSIFTDVNPLELIPFIGDWFDLDMTDLGDNAKPKDEGKKIGKNITEGVGEGIEKTSILSSIATLATSVIGSFKTEFGIHSPSTVMRDEIGIFLADGIAQGILDGASKITEAIGTIVNPVVEGAKGILGKIFGGGEEEQVNTDLLNIDLEKVKQTEEALRLLGETAAQAGTKAKEAFVSIRNVCYNQMVNCTNIIRNQAVSWSNIITNQATNARNTLTQQFISMASVSRTQMVNITNIVRNQATSWNNIIRNQVTNARNSLTSQMLSMAAVTRTQMTNITNIIRNQMLNCANIVRNQVANMQASLAQLTSMGINVGSGMSQAAQGTASAINRSSNSLSSPKTSTQVQTQSSIPKTASTASSSSKSTPLNVTLKMNDIEMGKAVVDSLNALASHGGSVDLPI